MRQVSMDALRLSWWHHPHQSHDLRHLPGRLHLPSCPVLWPFGSSADWSEVCVSADHDEVSVLWRNWRTDAVTLWSREGKTTHLFTCSVFTSDTQVLMKHSFAVIIWSFCKNKVKCSTILRCYCLHIKTQMILIFLSNVFLPNQTFFCVSTEAQRVKLHFFSFFFLVIHFQKFFFYLVWSSLGSKHRKQKHLKNFIWKIFYSSKKIYFVSVFLKFP